MAEWSMAVVLKTSTFGYTKTVIFLPGALLRTGEREALESPSPRPAAEVRSTAASGLGFDQAAATLIADYEMNGKHSVRTLRLRITKHVQPFFGAYPLTEIRPPVVRTFITRRQAAGASNAAVNRDLITLIRMLTLAVQDGSLATKPSIRLLKEQNVRRGFFEPEQFQRITAQLPEAMRGIAAFA